MQLYHGSNLIIKTLLLINQERNLDFGKGFYTTSNKEQAIIFSKIVVTREKKPVNNHPFVSIYNIDDSILIDSNLKILIFNSTDEQWLDFVTQNRKKNLKNDYDIIIGPTVDDLILPTLLAYEYGAVNKIDTLNALKIKPSYNQFVFKTNKSINLLNYIDFIDAGIQNG
jgi:hypothetical protein